ncbi:serine/threonine-protein kinase ATR [Drosophila willistoni]|uniref:Serine/threonine-protein kinase ATR n=1 Tax=Drosophila willistoni TaxID=7260 RepID=B4MQN5_DROWI|nr:serine/threonine-protein kinase ATR [Drosophila willistoni]
MTRRKEMWKILYNVVNRSEIGGNLEEVFNVIDEILCQEASLISGSEFNCKFQDTFLLWLLNKLAQCILNNNAGSDVSQCIELQKKLISSCWSNHSKLFERIVLAYIDVLQVIYEQLTELQFSKDAPEQSNEQTLILRIFACEVSLLQEFDSQCSHKEIHVRLDQIDGYARNMLTILQHAHGIGHATHAGIFAGSLQQALLILKECDVETKLSSMNYCHEVLRMQSVSSWHLNADVSHYAQLSLKAVTMMWSMVPKWLEVRLINQLEIQNLVVLTKNLLLVMRLPGKQTLDLGHDLLNEILSLPLSMDKSELVENLANYLQKPTDDELVGSLDALQHLVMSKWRIFPVQLMPVLSCVAAKQTEMRSNILCTLTKSLNTLFQKIDSLSPVELDQMLSILRALKQLEMLLLQQRQQQVFADEQTNHMDCDLLIKLPLQFDLVLTPEINWNLHALNIIEQDQKSRLNFTEKYFEICSLLMKISCVRPNLKSQTQQQLLSILQRNKQLDHLCSIKLETPSSAHTQLQLFFAQENINFFTSQDEETVKTFFDSLPQLYMSGYIKTAHLLKALPTLSNPKNRCLVLRLLLCSQSETIHVFRVEDQLLWYCSKCRPMPEALPGCYLGKYKSSLHNFNFTNATLQSIAEDMLFQPDFLYIVHHLNSLKSIDPQICLRLLTEKGCGNLSEQTMSHLVPVMSSREPRFMKELAVLVLTSIQQVLAKPVQAQSVNEQRKLLRLLVGCAYPGINEIWLFHWFKMTFFFLVHIRSLVVQEAVLAASEMCARHNLQTVTLWNWYKRDALALAVRLALNVYLSDGVRFTRSLKALSKMLGFSCVQEFTCKYHRLLTTMVLPYCMKEPRCKGVLLLISKQLRKPISTLFATSFLRIYTHVHLTETPELANSCIDFVVNCTKSSLQQLMNADVKQTVAELLIYFNRDPTFIMRSFQSLLHSSEDNCEQYPTSSQSANAEFAAFIAERFLGVITHFESCLGEPSFEKPLKEETLYSLGQIMRLVGSQHVTQFRFKIIAMLTFVHTLNETRLQRICLKIWHIFLHVVNVQELGPSLGRIVATLQPLLNDKETVDQVNDLYEFVILKNASMLGNFITDLYFLERMENVSPAIRQCIKRHTSHLHFVVEEEEEDESSSPQLLVQLQFLYKHITDECLQVRIYGLQHLGALFGRRRGQLNRMILNELPMEPLIEQIVNVLVAGCQHDDRQLQMASAKCLGELGAIDASYLPSNYNFSKPQQLPLSVLSEEFTILALTALCRGYQFQQKTKHVDSFSLAIQETLAVCGISPKEKKKVQLWQSLPSRMRQVMEPLLYSCYTSSQRPSSCNEQPIFGSHYTKNSYEEWAFLWASRLIDYIQSTETRHLLSSYKPCIKRDANMLSTFYPYIVLHALLECKPEQRKHVQEEFVAVLQANEEYSVSTKSQQDLGSHNNAFKLFESKKYAAGIKPVSDQQQEREEDSSHVPRLAGKLCAELLDFLQRWLREWQRLHGRSTGGKPPQIVDANYRKIYEFLKTIPKLLVSQASYNCGEYPRALSYLESYLEEGDKAKRILEQFTFLIEIYGKLMDADSVEGAVQVRSYDMSVTQEILVNRLVERQQDMITCYEQLLSSTEELQPDHIRAIIDAYLRMDTPKTALLIADGLWQRLSDQFTEQYFSECKSELLWRLGSYEDLEEQAKPNWPALCAQGCLALRQPLTSRSQFNSLLDGMRHSVLEQLRSCSANQQHSYAHAYDEIVKLHLVYELQCSQRLLDQLQLEEQSNEQRQECLMKAYFEDWQLRLQVLQPQVRVLEPIYSFRRNLLTELQRRLSSRPQLHTAIQTELGQLWLNSAQINRNAGQLQRAQLYILKAAEYQPTGLFLERAKLLWQKGDQVMAINYLEEQLSTMRQDQNATQLPPEQRKLYFEGKYLLAVYNAESMHLCADSILKYFRDAIAVQRQSERCHVQFAQFLEKIREAKQSAAGGNKPHASTHSHADDDMLLQVMLYYAKSLRYGNEHIYQSMPRLISLWLDTAETTTNSELIKKMNDLLTNCSSVLPSAMFYTAYSQMLSRLCHPQGEVFSVLRIIIIRLIEDYPQQSLWMLLPHFKSATANRIKRAKLILTETRLQTSRFQKLLADFNTLTERLIGLTNKEVTLDRNYQLSDLDKRLSKLCNPDFSEILLPFEKYMRPTLPISSTDATPTTINNSQNSTLGSNWFPYQQIYISGFQEQVLVLRSAAKPKKLTIRCSDGLNYDVLVKPKDDLRRDARLMEFDGLVKRYLHQDARARQRRLHIRTYAVLPFNEECGLVEWLPNLNSYRGICTSLHAQIGQGMGARMLQQNAVPLHDPIERKREVFLKVLLPAHPPVFQEWLRQRFTTPHSWYEARNSYIRTTAVMSMVGYILGLGDRHGENILIDEHNADVVHVDFNCLFNQGESLAYPEVVPFRLTHNMTVAMGPLGVEGSFRKCCEITLRLLKQEAKTLMSMLRPFVYDLGNQRCLAAATAKITNDVQRIADRLQGHVTRQQANSIPLSTEGQVNYLINEATKVDNLAVMYIGWGSFL